VVYDRFLKACKELVPVKDNLIDMASSQPKPTHALSDIWILKQEFSGMNSKDKVKYVRQKMEENNSDCYVLTALDEIAWVLNRISLEMHNFSPWGRHAL
jgi:Xaa-Pro aminopeptidase